MAEGIRTPIWLDGAAARGYILLQIAVHPCGGHLERPEASGRSLMSGPNCTHEGLVALPPRPSAAPRAALQCRRTEQRSQVPAGARAEAGE